MLEKNALGSTASRKAYRSSSRPHRRVNEPGQPLSLRLGVQLPLGLQRNVSAAAFPEVGDFVQLKDRIEEVLGINQPTISPEAASTLASFTSGADVLTSTSQFPQYQSISSKWAEQLQRMDLQNLIPAVPQLPPFPFGFEPVDIAPLAQVMGYTQQFGPLQNVQPSVESATNFLKSLRPGSLPDLDQVLLNLQQLVPKSGELQAHWGSAVASNLLQFLSKLVTESEVARSIGKQASIDVMGGVEPIAQAFLDSISQKTSAISSAISTILPSLSTTFPEVSERVDATLQALAPAFQALNPTLATAEQLPTVVVGATMARLAELEAKGFDAFELGVAVTVVAVAMLASVPASRNDVDEGELSHEYSYADVARYFSRRPLAVAQRSWTVATEMLSFGLSLLSDVWSMKVKENEPVRAEQLRMAIERLGPAYVKVAQAVSTRADLLSPGYLRQIQLLQDQVKAFPCEEARAALAKALGRPLDNVFQFLSSAPIASASLGQVYRGTLVDDLGGLDVAVKVQRPDVLESVALDLLIMRWIAEQLCKLPSVSSDWPKIMDAWALRFFHEMDYEREADNAVRFTQDMAGLKGIFVPQPMMELTSTKVLVTEWVPGEKLCESSASDVRELCNTLLNAYLTQLLDTGFMHADPHPGNLVRTPDGRICILDFGLMTEISEDQRNGLLEYIAHLTTEDWSKVAEDLQRLDFIPDSVTDVANSGMVAPIGRILAQLSSGGGATKANIDVVMVELDKLSERYPFRIPPFFALILRTFSVIEGIALTVDPTYSIVRECSPYLARRLLADESPRARQALRDVLYGRRSRLDVSRLTRMVDAFASFTTDGLADTRPSTSETAVAPRGAAAAPLVDPAAREVLGVLFSEKPTYLQDLMIEEVVAAADALSRDVVSAWLATFVSSTAGAAPRGLSPAAMLARVAPAVAITEDDRQALDVVYGVSDMISKLLPSASTSGTGSGILARLPPPSMFTSAAAATTELGPLASQLAPGVYATSIRLAQALAQRVVLRNSAVAAAVFSNSPRDDKAQEYEQSMAALS